MSPRRMRPHLTPYELCRRLAATLERLAAIVRQTSDPTGDPAGLDAALRQAQAVIATMLGALEHDPKARRASAHLGACITQSLRTGLGLDGAAVLEDLARMLGHAHGPAQPDRHPSLDLGEQALRDLIQSVFEHVLAIGFDEDEPVSILAALQTMRETVDAMLAPYADQPGILAAGTFIKDDVTRTIRAATRLRFH